MRGYHDYCGRTLSVHYWRMFNTVGEYPHFYGGGVRSVHWEIFNTVEVNVDVCNESPRAKVQSLQRYAS